MKARIVAAYRGERDALESSIAENLGKRALYFIITLVREAEAVANNNDLTIVHRITKELVSDRKSFA